MEVIRVLGRAPDLTDFLREAMLSQRFADVALCCPGGQRFLAHRLVLSAASPYLQEVLLAHSKSTSSSDSEPVTMILAEVEGPELAALLGLVYTGSATVPRPRLEAFVRAAETLRIRLPAELEPREHWRTGATEPLAVSYRFPMPYCPTAVPAYQQPELPPRLSWVGEDLSHGRVCCEWSLPRRPVANQVQASPWSQTIRPHPSPKIQPIVLQTRSPTVAAPADAWLSARGVQADTAEAPRTTTNVSDWRCCEVYCSQTGRAEYNDYNSQSRPASVPTIEPQKPAQQSINRSESGKPELSLPVSRLVDDIDDEKIEKKIVPSDDNNNNNEETAREPVKTATVQHKCDQCAKTFVTKASLKVHVRTHSGEKPFRCEECGKEFSQLRNYKYHRSVHLGTREFAATCPECGKYFNDRGYLSSHMKIHRNRKEYSCQECGKSFNQRVAYNMHVRIHTGLKPHQCDQCGKAFSRKMLLKQHLRTHSGERPYTCDICHKAFADRSNMTLHTRLHSGLKPYQCQLCNKAFSKKHHLKTHLNYHTGSKPYSCPNCKLAFSQSSNMRTHYKKCALLNPPPAPPDHQPATASAQTVLAP